jgi:copper ion binding protein
MTNPQATFVLKVQGMTCNHCVKHVTQALTGLEGVDKVDVQLQSGQVTVTHHGTAPSTGSIKEALDDAGYDLVTE